MRIAKYIHKKNRRFGRFTSGIISKKFDDGVQIRIFQRAFCLENIFQLGNNAADFPLVYLRTVKIAMPAVMIRACYIVASQRKMILSVRKMVD